MNSKITLGATAAILKANGYSPRALHGDDSYRHADDLAVVICAPKTGGNLGMLTVCVSDKSARSEVLAILSKHGVGKGPVRTDSAGNSSHVVAISVYGGLASRQSEPFKGEDYPALAFDCYGRVGLDVVSAVVRADGAWTGGTLLDTPRDELPSLDETTVSALFCEVDALLSKGMSSIYKLPPVSAARKAGIAAEAKLQAELDARTDAAIWREVDSSIRQEPRIGSSPWERDESERRLTSIENRCRLYDSLVAKRDGALAARARQGRRAGQLEEHLKSA